MTEFQDYQGTKDKKVKEAFKVLVEFLVILKMVLLDLQGPREKKESKEIEDSKDETVRQV